MAKLNNKKTSVDSIKHQAKRKNIPTRELRDFVADDEAEPKTLLYPRDPSLDPQLVWKGKDDQDREDLAVPAVPIYIQDKIHPQAIIEDIRAESAKGEPENLQFSLFADFNGLPEEFEQRVDFYHHEGYWQNRMILGDSLLVMTSLSEKEGLKGKVQTIYIDPPYGIKFGSNWQVSTRKRDVKDGKAEDATRQPEQIRAFRDTWKLGIHSYLAYLRDRLIVARELLTETGSCFVQIGDENVHLVRCLMDEVFGSENFCQLIPFRKKLMPLGATLLEGMYDYLLWYSKNIEHVKFHHLYKGSEAKYSSRWTNVQSEDGNRRKLTKDEADNPNLLPAGSKVYRLVSQRAPSFSSTSVYDFNFEGRVFPPPKGGCWVSTKEKMEKLAYSNRLESEGDNLSYVYFHDDFPLVKLNNLWDDTSPTQDKKYVVQTSTGAIQRCLLMTTDPGDLVLDPTCGSGTTAYVAEQWGRRWITIDTSRVALALARTRLMSARYAYYHLSECYPQVSQLGADEKTIKKFLRESAPSVDPLKADVRKGFVYKRVPHITLKSIANNPDIKEGMTREEIDAAIARHTEFETLYDQPYEDPKTVRVCGPFTMESLSPHRVLPADEDFNGEVTPKEDQAHGDFTWMILDNLKKAGVQNTRRDERLKFDRLEPFAGTYIHAEGDYTENEKSKRVAVCIGPEHGTVGPDLIKEAAKEAVQGIGFDLLIVCGFAFDPHCSEESKRYGKLMVLNARMNPDLAMGDELLKKTGAGNLFMVFGEPDVEIKYFRSQKQAGKGKKDQRKSAKSVDEKEISPQMTPMNTDLRINHFLRKSAESVDKIVVEIKGVDIYDPTTGEIRSGKALDPKTGKEIYDSNDDIACWFIDTNYNGESFFVRHAYFCGDDQPYEKLKKALRSEINEDAWDSIYSTVSRPFDPPETGKIAIKVINHYGDEVMKVYEIK